MPKDNKAALLIALRNPVLKQDWFLTKSRKPFAMSKTFVLLISAFALMCGLSLGIIFNNGSMQ